MRSPEEKAVEFANKNASSLFQKAKRDQLPKAYSLGWATVKRIALEVFERGGGAKAVREAVLEHASETENISYVKPENRVPVSRAIPTYLSGGKVCSKRRDI